MPFTVDDVLRPRRDWTVVEFEGPRLTPAALAALNVARKAGRQLLFIAELVPRASRGKAVRIGLALGATRVVFESDAGTDDIACRIARPGLPVEARPVGKLVDDESVLLGLLCDGGTEATKVTMNGRQVAVVPATAPAGTVLGVAEDILDVGDVVKILVGVHEVERHENRAPDPAKRRAALGRRR